MWGSGPIRTQREEKEEAALAAKLGSVWGFLGFDLGLSFSFSVFWGNSHRRTSTKRNVASLLSHDKDLFFLNSSKYKYSLGQGRSGARDKRKIHKGLRGSCEAAHPERVKVWCRELTAQDCSLESLGAK